MGREHLRINQFGFAEYVDMAGLVDVIDLDELAAVLGSIVELMLLDESGLVDSMSDDAQADILVPLSLSARMLDSGEYSAIELIAAASTVRYCAEPHLAEFAGELVRLLSRLPR